jgi:hypothetical protein
LKKPNLFILGAPKCGTTSMAHYLSQHPQVFFSKIKEPHYFNTDSSHRYFFKEKEYLQLFKESTSKHIYRGEGSVWYLYSSKAVDNISEFNNHSKFIVMLRNPTDMFFSLHQELLFGGTEDVKSPIEAWDLQKIRKNNKKIPTGCTDKKLLQYKDICMLGIQVKSLLSKVRRDQIFFITLNELKSNPRLTFKNLLIFLGIDIVNLKNYEVVNEKKVRKSYFISRLFSFITALKVKIGIRGGLGIANTINKFNVKSGKEIKIDDEQDIKDFKERLRSFFINDIELLERLTNKNLNLWKKND